MSALPPTARADSIVLNRPGNISTFAMSVSPFGAPGRLWEDEELQREDPKHVAAVLDVRPLKVLVAVLAAPEQAEMVPRSAPRIEAAADVELAVLYILERVDRRAIGQIVHHQYLRRIPNRAQRLTAIYTHKAAGTRTNLN